MKRLPKIKPLAAALALLLAACSSTPDGVLAPEPMARLMADLELAESQVLDGRLGEFFTDSARLDVRRAVLAKHRTNEATLDSSLRWYGANLPLYLQVIDRADTILGDSLHAVEALRAAAATAAAGDTADVWPLAPSAVFDRNLPPEFLAFEVEADSAWRRGDVVALEFAYDNALSPLAVTLGVDYGNRARTTESVTERVYPGDERRFKVELQLDSNISAKRIFGYFLARPAEGERAYADSIRLVRTRLVRNDYNHLRRRSRAIRRHDL